MERSGFKVFEYTLKMYNNMNIEIYLESKHNLVENTTQY